MGDMDNKGPSKPVSLFDFLEEKFPGKQGAKAAKEVNSVKVTKEYTDAKDNKQDHGGDRRRGDFQDRGGRGGLRGGGRGGRGGGRDRDYNQRGDRMSDKKGNERGESKVTKSKEANERSEGPKPVFVHGESSKHGSDNKTDHREKNKLDRQDKNKDQEKKQGRDRDYNQRGD